MKNLFTVLLVGMVLCTVSTHAFSWFKRSTKTSSSTKRLKRVPASRDLHALEKGDNKKNYAAATKLIKLPQNATPFERAKAEEAAWKEFKRTRKQ